jgi:dipeptidyl aminopeptidase/acylaminoacyl peptidase
MKIDTSGGPAQTVCAAPSGRGGTWSQNGVIIFAPKVAGSLEQVAAAGGDPVAIFADDKSSQQLTARWPLFLPDGNHFLYWSGNPFAIGAADTNGIFLSSLDGKQRQFMFPADSDALYAAPGYLLFLRGDTLMAQPFDANGVKLTGDAVPIAEHIGNPQKYRLGHFSVSQHGELIYEGSDTEAGQVTWIDASGKQLSTLGDPGGVQDVRLSPDGKTLVESIEDPGTSNNDLWLVDLSRGVRTRFTFDPASHGYPAWSPDGREIAFSSTHAGNLSIFEKAANGTGDIQPLAGDGVEQLVTDWSRDGRYIAYNRLDTQTGGGFGIWILPLFGDKKAFPFIQNQYNLLTSTFSPDGKWIAYSSQESGRRDVFISSFPGGSSKFQVSANGGSAPRWRADGKELFYISDDNKMTAVEIQEEGGSLEIGNAQALFPVNASSSLLLPYDVTSDGKKFVIVVPITSSGEEPITLVTNWTAAVKKP